MKLNFSITRRFSIDINDLGDKWIELDTKEFMSSNELMDSNYIKLKKENTKRFIQIDGNLIKFLSKIYPFKLKDEIRLLVKDTYKFKEFDRLYMLQEK